MTLSPLDTVRVKRDDPEGAEGLGIKGGMEGLAVQRDPSGWVEVMLILNPQTVAVVVLREDDLESTEEA